MWQVQEIQHCEDELLRLSELARIWIVDDLENRQQSGDAEAFDEAGNHQSKAERNLSPKTMLPEHPEGVGEGRGAKDFVFSHLAANRRRTFRDMPVWRAGLLNTGCPLVNLGGLPASGPILRQNRAFSVGWIALLAARTYHGPRRGRLPP